MRRRAVVVTKPDRTARTAWYAHYAVCFTCKENPKGLCDEGIPLLDAALLEMGDGRKKSESTDDDKSASPVRSDSNI